MRPSCLLYSLCGLGMLFSSLKAEENQLFKKNDSMVVNSGEAQYDGKEIRLVGQVAVQHSLGEISARALSVQPSTDKDKKNKLGILKISEQVKILFKGGGELHCEQAEINLSKMQGVFLGNQEQPDVIYLNKDEENEEAEKTRPVLEIKSLKMILDLVQEPAKTASKSKILVKQVEADQQIRVRYNEQYLLLADHAVYQRISDDLSPVAGLLTLTMQEELPECKMTTVQGDRLSACLIQLNTLERRLWLSQPNGLLYLKRDPKSEQTLEFTSQDLWWDDPKQSLLLKGQVSVNQNNALHITTDGELTIAQRTENGKRTLRMLHSPQDTHIAYADLKKGNVHKVHCPGTLTINHENQEMHFQGLTSTTEGIESRQVHVDDLLGEMYADDVRFNYQWENKQLNPGKMILEGHVRLINRFDGHMEESGSILHYALADHVEYFPESRELILKASEGQRVLFFDKVNNVQMSAPALKVRHDATTNKESIQGVGDVRFTFIEQELDQLKRQFPLGNM